MRRCVQNFRLNKKFWFELLSEEFERLSSENLYYIIGKFQLDFDSSTTCDLDIRSRWMRCIFNTTATEHPFDRSKNRTPD